MIVVKRLVKHRQVQNRGPGKHKQSETLQAHGEHKLFPGRTPVGKQRERAVLIHLRHTHLDVEHCQRAAFSSQLIARDYCQRLSQQFYRTRDREVCAPGSTETALTSPFSVHEYSHSGPRKTKQVFMQQPVRFVRKYSIKARSRDRKKFAQRWVGKCRSGKI